MRLFYHLIKNEHRPSTKQVVEAVKGYKNLGVVAGISYLRYNYKDIIEISQYLKEGHIKALKFYPKYKSFLHK